MATVGPVNETYNGYGGGPRIGELIKIIVPWGRPCLKSHPLDLFCNLTGPWGLVIGKQHISPTGLGKGQMELTVFPISSYAGNEEERKLCIPLPSHPTNRTTPEGFGRPLEIPMFLFREVCHLVIRRQAICDVKKWKAFNPPVLFSDSEVTRLLMYENYLGERMNDGGDYVRPPPVDAFSSLTASEGAARALGVSSQEFMEMEGKRRLDESRVRIEDWRQEVSEFCSGYQGV